MKREITSVLLLAVILTSTLNLALIVQPSQAETILSSEALPDEGIDFADYEYTTLEESAGTQEKPSGVSPQAFQGREDRWDFQNISEWSSFIYADGNRTRLIVGVRADGTTNLFELEGIVAKHKAEIVNTVAFGGEIRALIVELLWVSVGGFVEDIRCEGSAAYIEPDVKVKVQFVPNDPYWNLQWGPQVIEADWAWNTTTGNQTVLVAVVDTGIDYTHSDLSNYVSLGYDWVNNDTDPMDDYGHGTHCAGIIAATLNNSVGVAGLAQVQIMAEKVLDSWGYGYSDWIANGIIHAADSGADVISMSLGSYSDSELVHEAVRYAYNAGVLIVASAGNDNVNINAYPATYDEVIAVAATNDGDHKASFSNWGEWIELAAPGVHIYSTVPWGYEYASGTSMACPHIAGLAALILSQYPNKTRDWLRIRLRYTCDDLGSVGFDVYFGHGRINARNAVEHDPPEHELIAYRWDTPPYVKPGTVETINATILNFGQAEETNVSVHLLANDTIVDSASIGSLAPGISTEISLDWNVTIEGLYNVTLFISSVPNETNKEDNVLFKFLFVGLPVKALVLHSAGNIIGDTITNWQVLNSEWRRFGNKMVCIDYTTLNKEDITYDDIIATNADVLIISCAADRFSGWEFTDSEIEAIERYVHEGHGLIATAGTLYYQAPNNNKLAPFFGLEESTMWDATGTDLLHLMNASHPVFTDVPDPLVFPYCGTSLPWDGSWDSNELTGGEYLALGHYLESSIVEYRGLIYISPWLEIIPVYYHHHLQLLYNAITWSKYQKPEHEIAVSLQCSPRLEPGESVTVNASVMNLGLNNETDIELFLSIDGEEKANMTSLTLEVDQTVTLTYPWTPPMGKYNITAYATPVPGEEDVYNNVKTKILRVSYPATIGFVETHGENLHGEDLNIFYENLGHIVTTITSPLTPQLLEDFDIIVVGEDWSDNSWSPMEIAAVHDFISSGKGFIGIGDELSHSVQEILSNYGIASTGYWGYPGSSNNLDHSHPIMEGVDSIYASNPVNSLEVDPPGYWLAYDSHNENMLIAGAEVGGYVLCLSDDFAMAIHYDDNNVMLTNIIDWMTVKYEHDLAVSWDVPAWVYLSSSTMLNVSVWNTGLNNETNVNLYLIINNTIIKNETINQLTPGQSHTINYTWTPTETGTYNITAYTPPKPEEESAADNVANILVRVGHIKGYILFDQTHLTDTILAYSNWVGNLTERWYIIDLHVTGSITQEALEGYDVFVIPQAHTAYSSTELSVIQNFVLDGGGLLVTGDDSPSLYTSLTSFASITWNSGGCGGLTTDITRHQVTEGVNTVYFRSPARLHTELPASNIIRDYCGHSMIAVSETGYGKVLAVADEHSINDESIDYGDNLILACNAIDWLATPRAEHEIITQLEAPELIIASNTIQLNASVANIGLNNETAVELVLILDGETKNSTLISLLTSGASHTITFVWNPTIEGMYNVTAYTSPVPGEADIENNRVTKLVWVKIPEIPDLPSDRPAVYVNPQVLTKPLGETFTISIDIFNLTDATIPDPEDPLRNLTLGNLYGFDIEFTWDPARIQYVDHKVTIPVEEHPYGILHEPILEIANIINEAGGIPGAHPETRALFAYASLSPASPFNGNGTVFHMTFRIIGEGTSELRLVSTQLANRQGQAILHTSLNGLVIVGIPPEGRDVSIVGMTHFPDFVYSGRVVNVTVVTANDGNVVETFNVTIYANTTNIGTQTVFNLPPRHNVTLTFTWNTTGLEPCCNFTLSAEATKVPGEINVVNNLFIGGVVRIKLWGDIDNNDVVDIYDIVMAIRAYGSCRGDPDWNPDADIAPRYGIVDIFDLVTIASVFGSCG